MADETPPSKTGESTTRRGEDVTDQEDEPGRETMEAEGDAEGDTGGAANRPVGKSDPRDSTGVNPLETITGDTQPSGDQGG